LPQTFDSEIPERENSARVLESHTSP
jgi:hypothetical protein